MFGLSKTLASQTTVRNNKMLFLSVRSATTITSPNDSKLINLLARLDKFDNKSKIFDKLDDLYLLSQRKGFFNLNANNLEFLSNNSKINDNINNLYNFNNLNKLVSNQYSNLLMIPNTESTSNDNYASNSANLLPLPRTSKNTNNNINNNKITINGSNVISSNPNLFKLSNPSIAKSIPGLNAFSATSTGYERNAPVDKYLNLLQGLARNDVELKNRIEQVLEAFNNEDDFFFNYVLEFWISGKSFNKKKAKKLEEETGSGQLPSNLTM